MVVLCLTGMPGSGKGEVVNIIKDKYSPPVVRMGDLVWEVVKEKGLPLESGYVGKIANEERELYGNDIWAKRCVDRVRESLENGESFVIIDGVRTPNEIAVFKQAFEQELYVLCVFTSPGTRLARIQSRGRVDDTASKEDFDERDRRELEWGLGRVIAKADLCVINEAGLDELKEDVLEVCKKILE